MKRFVRAPLFLIVLLAVASFCAAQSKAPAVSESSKLLAESELNAAVTSYREGKFADAQVHCQNAVALDPTNKTAPIFLARATHAQYRPGVVSDENMSKAQEAIAAYKQIMAQAPKDEEAYKAIAYLLGQMKEKEAQRDWILRRATDTTFDNKIRAEAYIVLASKDWDCAFKRTELPTTKKITMSEGNRPVVHYHMSSDVKAFEEAKQCANRGLSMADMAISLDPENESAWSYRTNILLENSKVSEMAQDEAERVRFVNEYEVALKETKRLTRTKETQQASEQRPPKKSTP